MLAVFVIVVDHLRPVHERTWLLGIAVVAAAVVVAVVAKAVVVAVVVAVAADTRLWQLSMVAVELAFAAVVAAAAETAGLAAAGPGI